MILDNLSRDSWSYSEDRALLDAKKRGLTFAECALIIPGRTLKGCKARYAKLVAVEGAPEEKPVNIENGNVKLLRAQLRTGQHFIKCPKAFRQICREVGL